MSVPRVNTDALALLAAKEGFRGRILGKSNPGRIPPPMSSQPTGQFVSPALIANPQITVNSSISSAPTPAISGGGGGGGGVSVAVPGPNGTTLAALTPTTAP